jgi:hypothetical protein
VTQLEHVPTVRELYERGDGSVVAAAWDKEGNPTVFRVLDRGHVAMGAPMRRNAAALREAGAADWVQPPSRDDIGRAIGGAI